MRFTTNTLFATTLLLVGNLFFGDIVWGNVLLGETIEFDPPAITLLVYDHARLNEALLASAEDQARFIFREAGIEVSWRNCLTRSQKDPSQECHRALDPNHFVVSIVSKGRKPGTDVFGISFLENDGTGNYADVFYDAIMTLRGDRTSESSLLAAVTAHEVGHLLLGLHSHSPASIMCAHWREEELHQVSMGLLRFNHEQASQMHQRIWDAQRNLEARTLDATNGRSGRAETQASAFTRDRTHLAE